MRNVEIDMIMMQAHNEAHLLQQSFLGSEHVLLSILRHETYPITKRLNACGMYYETVKEDVIDMNGMLPKHHHAMQYSDIVMDMMQDCDSAYDLIKTMLHSQYALAHSLMERYHIAVENLLH